VDFDFLAAAYGSGARKSVAAKPVRDGSAGSLTDRQPDEAVALDCRAGDHQRLPLLERGDRLAFERRRAG
jgi:hypothetical protein